MELAPLLAKVCTICGAEARRWVPGPPKIPPRPPPQGRGTHLEQGGGPGAVAQVLDDGDVAAQAAVHAAALVADEDAAVDGSPAGVCGGHGALRGGPFLPCNTRIFILGGQRRRSNAVVSQATARGSSHRRGKPKGFHWQPGTAWGGGAGFGLPQHEGGWQRGRRQPHAVSGGAPNPVGGAVHPLSPRLGMGRAWGGLWLGAARPQKCGHPVPVLSHARSHRWLCNPSDLGGWCCAPPPALCPLPSPGCCPPPPGPAGLEPFVSP